VTHVYSRTSAPAETVAEISGFQSERTCAPGVGLRPKHSGGEFGFSRIDVVVAETVGDYSAATQLLAQRYVPKGYSFDGGYQQSVSSVDPVLIAKNRLDGSALATLTLRVDGPRGLMAEHLYPEQVTQLRSSGCRVCEVVRFASLPSIRSFELLRRLFDRAYELGRQLDRTDVLIEVTPRHAAFYKRVLGFRAVGSPCHNPRVNTVGTLLHVSMEDLGERVERVAPREMDLLPCTDGAIFSSVGRPEPHSHFAA
jgi:hypothetical protein